MQSGVHRFSTADVEPLFQTLGLSGRPSARTVGVLAIIVTALATTALIGESARTSAILAVVTVTIAGFAWLTPAFSRRKLRQWVERHANCPAIVAWDDAGFRTGGCVHNEDCSFAWQTVHLAIVSPDYLILKTRSGPMIVPRRALDDAQSWDLQRRFTDHAIPVQTAGN